MKSLLVSGTILGAGLLLVSTVAQADDGNDMPDIVTVTASKVDRPAADLEGLSFIADAQAIDRNGVLAIDGLDSIVPGLSIHQRGARTYDNITLRGQSSVDFYGPKVQVYLDGIPEDQALFGRLLHAAVDRVEVLYGPQGTIYGRGAIGGVINVVTHRPGNGPRAALSARWDELSRSASGLLSGALAADTLFADITAGWEESDGEYRRLGTGEALGERTDRHAAARLRYAPAGTPIDITLATSFVDSDSTEEQFVPAGLLEARSSVPVDSHYNIEAVRISLAGSYDFGEATLTSLTSYQDRDMDRVVFGAASPEVQEMFSQEIRLASNASDNRALAYVIGAYYEHVDFTFSRPDFSLTTAQELTDLAVFGELVWPATDRLDLTVGARADRHEARATSRVPGIDLAGEDDFSAVTPRVGLGFDATENIRLYAVYSTGFKPGGFTRIATPGIVSFSYEPEMVDNFEIGMRASLLDGMLRVSASAYSMSNEDFQLFIGTQPNQYLQNVGEARSRGLDVVVEAQPTDRLLATLALAFNDAEFTAYDNPLTPGLDLSGNRLPHAPRFRGQFGASYVFDLPSGLGTLTPSLHVTRVSQVHFDETNTVGQAGFELYDVDLAWQATETLTLAAYATNLTDETYTVYGFDAGPGLGEVYQLGRSRAAGIRVSSRF